MTGKMLNKFDVTLCEYALDNIRLNMTKPAFSEYVAEILEPATLVYLTALGNEDRCKPLLLTEWELFDIGENFASGPGEFDKRWEVNERIHRLFIIGTRDIRESISLTHADAWASKSVEFVAQLERSTAIRPTRLSSGIDVIHTWVGEVRRHLRVMGATNFLPYPEGTFPTPACPEPPADRKSVV